MIHNKQTMIHSKQRMSGDEDLCRGAMAGTVPGVEILCNQVLTLIVRIRMMRMVMGMMVERMRRMIRIMRMIMMMRRMRMMRMMIRWVITMCNQAPTIKFSSRNSSTVWDFTVKSLKLLKGVTLLGVEHLQHFAIADVALVSKEGDFKYESKGQECLLKDEEEEKVEDDEEGEEEEVEEGRSESAAESTTRPPPTIYKYSFKLKFHTKIFGTFKQTLVLDFGVRPLLS